jgi:archaellum component FlaC
MNHEFNEQINRLDDKLNKLEDDFNKFKGDIMKEHTKEYTHVHTLLIGLHDKFDTMQENFKQKTEDLQKDVTDIKAWKSGIQIFLNRAQGGWVVVLGAWGAAVIIGGILWAMIKKYL